ncbi:hypothetical protein GCM10010446_29340 [Streptomyces enissocaesilis]|uniref:Uncharacterized protein n=1 Tax=Streptomyces enissocaesilis TaxID=332589 RepID=A0ABP6JQ62_9ACTN
METGRSGRIRTPSALRPCSTPCRPVKLCAAPDATAEFYGGVPAVWCHWTAGRPEGGPAESGRHLAEDAPRAPAGALRGSWAQPRPTRPRSRRLTGLLRLR